MTLKELLKGRKKLREYDELSKWKEKFENGTILVPQNCNEQYANGVVVTLRPEPLPIHIKSIIVAALEAEIAKLDEE